MKLSKQDEQVQSLADCSELALFTAELAQAIAYGGLTGEPAKQAARRIDALSRAISDKIDVSVDAIFDFDKVPVRTAS